MLQSAVVLTAGVEISARYAYPFANSLRNIRNVIICSYTYNVKEKKFPHSDGGGKIIVDFWPPSPDINFSLY